MLLTTYRRDGTPVPTPVDLAFDGAHAYFRTEASSGKVRRLTRNPIAEVAPSTMRGRATGPSTHARARRLDAAESDRADAALRRKYRIVHGVFVALLARFAGNVGAYFELTDEPA